MVHLKTQGLCPRSFIFILFKTRVPELKPEYPAPSRSAHALNIIQYNAVITITQLKYMLRVEKLNSFRIILYQLKLNSNDVQSTVQNLVHLNKPDDYDSNKRI